MIEPFYFKSYDKVVGVAHNVNELQNEIKRLMVKDPACVEYHLREGHIVQWLEYINENQLSKKLQGIDNPRKAFHIINKYEQKKSKKKSTINDRV